MRNIKLLIVIYDKIKMKYRIMKFIETYFTVKMVRIIALYNIFPYKKYDLPYNILPYSVIIHNNRAN